ncbi:hypothetical protein [Pseudoalteromonas sp.]|uniref:hypothetical protein n=1 Tax=Pseudoalteromonas sp. TaxID=53249 RepID=UPI001BD082A9|nr:hypothetical protein [Pseudoalteromonas sp.]
MNKLLLGLIVAPFFVLSAANVVANDATDASAEIIQEFTEMCVSWAKEDDISNEELYNYVLKCVNDELTAEGYNTVTAVKI